MASGDVFLSGREGIPANSPDTEFLAYLFYAIAFCCGLWFFQITVVFLKYDFIANFLLNFRHRYIFQKRRTQRTEEENIMIVYLKKWHHSCLFLMPQEWQCPCRGQTFPFFPSRLFGCFNCYIDIRQINKMIKTNLISYIQKP